MVATSCVVCGTVSQSMYLPYCRQKSEANRTSAKGANREQRASRRTFGGASNNAWMSFIRLELPDTRNVPSTSVAFSLR